MRRQFLLMCLVICCLGSLVHAASPVINFSLAAGTIVENSIVIPFPTITTFTQSGRIGSTVTVIGTNLMGTSAVKFNGVASTSITNISATSLKAIVPVGATTGKISVTTPIFTASSKTDFTVVSLPTITAFTKSGRVGSTVTVIGTNLTGARAVKFNGLASTTITNISATSLKAIVPVGATTGKISVTTPGGTATSATSFTVISLPSITAFTQSGRVGSTVTLIGTNLTGASAVKFNGVASTTITNISATALKAIVPVGATTGKISVTTPGGTASSATNFTVVSLPTITSFTPTSGHTGTVVTITGMNFSGATAVKFNGIAATTFTVISTTSITAVVPNGATSGKIAVTTAGGSASSSADFSVITAAINPADGASMIWVPGGTFTMGTPYGSWWGPSTQQVTLSGYWMYEFEVTVAQYRAFCAATSRSLPVWPGDRYSWAGKSGWDDATLQQHPIVNATWFDAKAYADWAGVYLPTEAQWEYAARGVQGRNFPWGGTATANDEYNGWDETKCANNDNPQQAGKSTWPVGSFPAGVSWCGVYDLAGNAMEWCADWYGDYSSTLVVNPTGPDSGDLRVMRDGSWDNDYESHRSALRNNYYQYNYWYDTGFRCVSLAPAP